MRIGIDVRGLNYPLITGVNTYTLHFLWLLSKVKQTVPDLTVIAIGLQSQRRLQLESEFPFLNQVFSDYTTLREFVQFPALFKNHRLLDLFFLLYFRLKKTTYFDRALPYDILFLPQPKLIVNNPKTKLVTTFHDLFGTIDRSTLNQAQKIINNIPNFRVLARSSSTIWVNSISTGKDVAKYLCQQDDSAWQKESEPVEKEKNHLQTQKIKLVYPSLPLWSELTSAQKNATDVSESKTSTISSVLIPKDKRYILALSGIEPRKNWYNLLLAHKFLQMHYPQWDIVLVLAGSIVQKPYYQVLLSLIESEKIQNVIWHLQPTDLEKNQLLKHCLFLAYPSFYEGFGFPILEAMAVGKTVLTSKISSMPEIAKDSALYINPLDFKDMASGMYVLAMDEKFRRTLEQRVGDYKHSFSWDEMQRAIFEMVKNVDNAQ